MSPKKKKNEISNALFQKRIAEISEIQEAFELGKPIKSSNLSKVGYILWQYPETRNSDITLALRYYQVFHKDLVQNANITFKNLYKLPKMYDIQRDRAKIQNDYKLFPASEDVQRKRKDRSDEYTEYFLKDKASENVRTAEYNLFFDESGKEDKYYILAGVSINSSEISLLDYKQRLQDLKDELLAKHHMNIEELKFVDIKEQNFEFYKEFIDKLLGFDVLPTFYSILVENNGLKRNSNRIKANKLLEFLLTEALNSIIQKATRNSLLNSYVNLNVFLDIDGKSPDLVEAKTQENNLQNTLNGRHKYFVKINTLQWLDSKSNIFIQLADLYASSLNNIFSDKPAESKTAKVKKDFAWFFLNKVGIKNIDDTGDDSFIFYNKAIVKLDDSLYQ